MLVEIDEITEDELVADVCIIGGGPAGVTVALELAGRAIDVVVLESGGRGADALSMDLSDGRSVGFPYFPLAGARLRGLGGSSAHWGGACWPLEPIDLERRDWVPHSGWPLDYGTLVPWYRRAQEICGLGPFEYDAGYWAARGDAGPLDLGADVIVSKLYQNSSPPRHFGLHFGPALEAAANIRTYLNATVTALHLENGTQRVARASVARRSGRPLTVRAGRFVLAGGGLENPRLLLASNDVHGAGLGNGEDQVGRYFMEHLFTNAGSIIVQRGRSLAFYARRRVDGTDIRAGFGFADSVLRRERILNTWIGIGIGGAPPNPAGDDSHNAAGGAARRTVDVMALTGDIELAGDATYSGADVDASFDHLQITCHAEQSPNPASRVTLDSEHDPFGIPRVRLDWRLTELDHRSIRRSLELLATRLGANGAGRLQTTMNEVDDAWIEQPAAVGPIGPFGSYHHMGTTRMSVSPRHGVVDATCCVHGLANLFIAGSSVFPTCGYANPTLTIVALALRLAGHLKREMAVS